MKTKPQRKMFIIYPCPNPNIDPPNYPCYAIPAHDAQEAAGFWFEAGNSSPIAVTDTMERRKWIIAKGEGEIIL